MQLAVWAKDTYQVSDALQQATNPKASVGLYRGSWRKAGKESGIMTQGIQGRAAARCGLGALIDTKNSKLSLPEALCPSLSTMKGNSKESANKILASSPLRKPEDWLVEAKGVFDSFITKGESG